MLFFIAYKLYDIYLATAVLIFASLLQLSLHWLIHRTVEKMYLVIFASVLILGLSTLYFQNDLFIKWKPTAINWALAVVFLASHVLMKKPLIRTLLEEKLNLPDHVWIRLSISWILFFGILGALNLIVAYSFDTDMWVNFKLFGIIGLTLVFSILQGLYLARYIEDAAEKPTSLTESK